MSCHDAKVFLRPTQLTVDLDAIVHNAGVAAAKAQGAMLCAVVKADAYGHGAVAVSHALSGAGVRWFATALLEEAIVLRQSGIQQELLVLAGSFTQAWHEVVHHRLTPVVSQLSDLTGLSQAAGPQGLDIHVEVDTGMARLGVAFDKVGAFFAAAKALGNVRITGLMSHLAHADDPHAEQNTTQMQRLAQAEAAAQHAGLTLKIRHMLNSGGLLCDLGPPKHMVRCGIALYGLQPQVQRHYAQLRPAMRWTTRPVAIRDVPAGTPVSYGGRFVTQRPTRLATLPVGYADGYKRLFSNRAQVLIRGQRAPVVGAVCMDLCMVDITDIAGVDVSDEVVLMGQQQADAIGADEMGVWADSFNYEMLCSVGSRVPRRYIGAGHT
ncbi:hypothetical protein Q3G72_023256 [Acer saccharum]|nr:hypothetical protein Q3G72_023256 [Acer saccharum]